MTPGYTVINVVLIHVEFLTHWITKYEEEEDNRPLVKFPPMNKRSLTQLLRWIITNWDQEVQTKELICVTNICSTFSVYLVRTVFPTQADSFLQDLSIFSSHQMGQLVGKFKEWREKLELSHEKAKHGKYT